MLRWEKSGSAIRGNWGRLTGSMRIRKVWLAAASSADEEGLPRPVWLSAGFLWHEVKFRGEGRMSLGSHCLRRRGEAVTARKPIPPRRFFSVGVYDRAELTADPVPGSGRLALGRSLDGKKGTESREKARICSLYHWAFAYLLPRVGKREFCLIVSVNRRDD